MFYGEIAFGMSEKGGLAYIRRRQRPDGGFAAYEIKRPTKRYRTTFVTSLIGLALQEVEESDPIRERLATFLLTQKSSDWAWNYWDRDSIHARQMPYPDDLDDTFLALTYLWHQDSTLFTPEVMAHIANLLFVTEIQPGGPYVTWVADETADHVWRDVDPIVNGNIASFLAIQGVELPGIEELVETAIKSDTLTSPYYPNLLPGAYLTARWYKGVQRDKLRDMILAGRKGVLEWGTAHETALAVCALLRLDYPAEELETAIEYIRKSQHSNGSWEMGSMYIVDVEYGSPALTTALCLEALALYHKADFRDGEPSLQQEQDPAYEAVISEVQSTIASLSQPELAQYASLLLQRILAQDGDRQIVLLSRLVQRVVGKNVDEGVLHSLAIISVWGWMAYTAFDDFLDDEGDSRILPSAVFAHRYMMANITTTLPRVSAFTAEVMDILGRIDGANAWEVGHCRGMITGNVLTINELPDYENFWQLADRSLGHAIAAVGVLYAAGYTSASSEMTALRDFFRHYLIARQLNDDAHDWQDDLRRGHVNAVAVLVLQKWCDGSKNRSFTKGIDLKRHGDRLRLIMWEEVISNVCGIIEQEIEQARRAVRGVPTLDGELLCVLLNPLERATKDALQARDDALEFIAKL